MPQNDPPAPPTNAQLLELWLDTLEEDVFYSGPPVTYARRVLAAFGQPPTPNPAPPPNRRPTPLESPQDQNPGPGKAGDDIRLNGRLFLRELAETMGVLSPTDDPSETVPISEIMPKMLARAREDLERWHAAGRPDHRREMVNVLERAFGEYSCMILQKLSPLEHTTFEHNFAVPARALLGKLRTELYAEKSTAKDGSTDAGPLRSTLSNLVGLIRLIDARPDVSRDLRDALTGSWRFREAVAALSDHDSTEARVK